jgi:hypothetical protein
MKRMVLTAIVAGVALPAIALAAAAPAQGQRQRPPIVYDGRAAPPSWQAYPPPPLLPPPGMPPLPEPAPVLAPAEVIKRIPAAEASQGVAVDATHFYAISNSRIGKYDKATGAKVAEWRGDPVEFAHMNSCTLIEGLLVCAASNYPQLPMASSVEFFDPVKMEHVRSVPLGTGVGSLTWVEKRGAVWWAAFANYDEHGAELGRTHRDTSVVLFDADWRRIGGYAFPPFVLWRFSPSSSSGGGFGPDGLLYVTGHDLPEVYALRVPQAGAVLRHVATIPLQFEGQAIDWDESQPGVLYGISRPNREAVVVRVPAVPRP